MNIFLAKNAGAFSHNSSLHYDGFDRNLTPSTSTTTLCLEQNMGTKTLEMVDRPVPFQHMGKASCSPLGATDRDGSPCVCLYVCL